MDTLLTVTVGSGGGVEGEGRGEEDGGTGDADTVAPPSSCVLV